MRAKGRHFLLNRVQFLEIVYTPVSDLRPSTICIPSLHLTLSCFEVCNLPSRRAIQVI